MLLGHGGVVLVILQSGMGFTVAGIGVVETMWNGLNQ